MPDNTGLWQQLTQGRNPLGTSGVNITNAMMAGRGGGDRIASPYINWQQTESGYLPSASGKNLDSGGNVIIDGKQYVQVGDMDPSQGGGSSRFKSLDPTQFQYNNDYGVLTPASNMNVKNDFIDNAMPVLMAAGLGGIAAAAELGGGAVAASGSADFGVAGGGSAGIGAGASGGGAINATEAFAAAGAPAASGAESGGFGIGGGGSSGVGAGGPGSSGNSLFDSLRTLNQARSGLNLGRNLLSLAGRQSGSRGGNMAGDSGQMDISSILSGILGLGAVGRSAGLFGNGTGTPGGATANATTAANRADPWGAPGPDGKPSSRQQFQDILTPDFVMGLINPDPSKIANEPGYQFQMKQGTAAINMSDAAGGTLRSGNRGFELEQFGQGLASTSYNAERQAGLSELSALAGLGGATSSNPTAASRAITGGFSDATSLQNNGLNSLLGNGMARGGNPIGALLSSGINGISGILKNIFGSDNSGDYSVLQGLPAMSGPGAFDGGDAISDLPSDWGMGLFG